MQTWTISQNPCDRKNYKAGRYVTTASPTGSAASMMTSSAADCRRGTRIRQRTQCSRKAAKNKVIASAAIRIDYLSLRGLSTLFKHSIPRHDVNAMFCMYCDVFNRFADFS